MATAAIAAGMEQVSWLGRWLGRENSTGPTAPTKDVLPVLAAADLLAVPHRAKHLRDIERLAGIPSAHFDTLYRSAVESFTRWVQQLPVSEAHHHADPGGMLDHTLQVVVRAMAKRRVHLLPHGADPETITREQHRWTYAVFSAALLHDIGKPAVHQHVQLIDGDRREQGRWDAWSGPMPLGMWYRVTFVRGCHDRLHETVSPLLAHLILPQAALSWLAEDQQVLHEWLAAIGGDREHRGVVSEIIEYTES
jgi:integrating conjugative element relaxase (TIGR03760 family)